ncbi:hypothetical protein [Pseudomonas fluorescens]|uniref:Uncharacterized protein n=1 Tax=Pseudomonas fluorescens TaxID=294 RepID=A0A5E7FBL7_PSEFL|nr:hypothetical protein [Pseudomonas fluorescens]VVO36811.1 hypothetical protein PS691_05387 [Pseudomonas fluorescens]
MALAAPILVLKLSNLKDPLEISISDSSDLFLEGTVNATLGKDEEYPDWSGYAMPAGKPNFETDEYERLLDLKVYVPKEELGKYINQTVELRYQTIGESGLAMSSPPVVLHIEE